MDNMTHLDLRKTCRHIVRHEIIDHSARGTKGVGTVTGIYNNSNEVTLMGQNTWIEEMSCDVGCHALQIGGIPLDRCHILCLGVSPHPWGKGKTVVVQARERQELFEKPCAAVSNTLLITCWSCSMAWIQVEVAGERA